LGIGLRVAGRMAGKGMAASAQSVAGGGQRPASSELPRAAGRTAGRASRGLARGVGGFLRPFSRLGGILWLEVTGVFFFLPVVIFAPTLWRVRANWLNGPDHKIFLVTAGVMALFSYLGVTSFLRARKK